MSSSSPNTQTQTRVSPRTRNSANNNNTTGSDDSYSPEYNEKHPNFPFSTLHVPPPEWELYDIPDKTHLRNRALDLATFKKLVRHHTWGFDVVIGDRKTKDRLLQVLKRIVYNQEASLRPTWHEFVSRNCDAGPRLLRQSYDALRISRRFPDGVPGQPLRWGGVLPKDTRATSQGQGTSARGPGTGSGISGIASQGYVMNSMQPPYMMNTNGNGMYGASPYMSTLNAPPNPTFMYDQHHVANPILPTLSNPHPPTPMSVCPPTPPLLNSQLPSTNPPLRLAVTGEIPHFTPSSTGTLYPTHGRGPVSLSAPCDPISCTILAGILLRLNPPPTFPNQPSQLSSIESAFFTTLNIPWSALPDAASSARLDEFRTLCREYVDAVYKASNPLAAINGETRFIPLSPYNVWSICANSVPGVQTRFLEGARGCVCQSQTRNSAQSQNLGPVDMKLVNKPYITTDALDGCGRAVDLDTSIRRYFAFERGIKCTKCGRDNALALTRKFEHVPQILAIRPDPRVGFERHGSEVIDVEYVRTTDKVHRARYRWVGGMYPIDSGTQTPVQQQQLAQNGQRVGYKIFWADRDSTPGAMDTGALRVYDATQLSGTIVGNVRIPVFGLGERVPAKWWAGCVAKESSPMLFYEKFEDTGTAAAWGLDLGQGPIGTELQPLNTPLEADIRRGTSSQSVSLAPSQHPDGLGGIQNAGSIDIDPNVQFSPGPLHWSSSGHVDFKADISDSNMRSSIYSDALDNIFSHPGQLASSSTPVTQDNNGSDGGNVVTWVSHSESQPNSSTGATTGSKFSDDSRMFMALDPNFDMGVNMGIETTDSDSLHFASGGSTGVTSTYSALPEVTSSSGALPATTATAKPGPSIATATASTGALVVDPQLTMPDAKSTEENTNTTATIPASTTISEDMNWVFDFPGATNSNNTHPNPTSANRDSITATPTPTAPTPTLPLAPTYNAFDASLDAYNNSLSSEASSPDAKQPPTTAQTNTTPLVPSAFSSTPAHTSTTGTNTPGPGPGPGPGAGAGTERNYLPPTALTLARKRSLTMNTNSGNLVDGAREKRMKML